MAERKHDDGKMILMLIHEEGPMSLQEVQEHFFKFVSQMGFGFDLSHEERSKRGHARTGIPDHLENVCDTLVKEGLLEGNNERYTLTETGKKQAESSKETLQKAARWVHKHVLSAEGATKNTIFIDALLACTKLIVGAISSSAGLLADGADAAIDTLSAGVVYWSVKKRKEVVGTMVVILMMLVTSVGIFWDSLGGILDVLKGIPNVLSHPAAVIAVESLAFFVALFLSFYQKFIGIRERNFALVSQSVDSKNHIYVSLLVILGAVFSLFGIRVVDSIVGIFIALRIFLDCIGLFRETLSVLKGEEIDFEKHGGFYAQKWKAHKGGSFRAVIVYMLLDRQKAAKNELIDTLNQYFKPGYLPALSEFQFGFAFNTDFENTFEEMMRPLVDTATVLLSDGFYLLNPEKKAEIEEAVTESISRELMASWRFHKGKSIDDAFRFREKKLGVIRRFFPSEEKITAISSGIYKNRLFFVITTPSALLLLSKKRDQCERFSYESIKSISLETGKFATYILCITVRKEAYRITYLSRHRSRLLFSHLENRLPPEKKSGLFQTKTVFSEKISALSKIKKYLES